MAPAIPAVLYKQRLWQSSGESLQDYASREADVATTSLTDVVLRVGKIKTDIAASKATLAAHSKVLRTMLHDMPLLKTGWRRRNLQF